MSNVIMDRDAREELKTRFRDNVSQQSRMLKVPTASEAIRQHCITQVLEAIESFLLSWEQQPSSNPSTVVELPSGLVREAFSVLLSAVGPGDAMVRETTLSWLVTVQSTESRQVLLDVLPSTMPLDHNGLEEATRQVLDALEVVLVKDWTSVLPILGCLSILPLDDKGKRKVLELAVDTLSTVTEPELPVLIRTLLRHIVSDGDATLALEAVRTEMVIWETNRSDDDPDDEGVIPLVIHIVLSSFRDPANRNCIKVAYITRIQKLVRTLSDRIDQGGEVKNDKDRTGLSILDTAALLFLRGDSNLSTEAESLIDNLLQMNCFPFEKLSLLLHFTFDRKRRKPTLLNDLLGSSLVAFSFFVLLFPVRVAMISESSATPVMQHIQEFVVVLYHRLDMQRQRELVLGLVHLSDESSFSIQQPTTRKRGRPRGTTKGSVKLQQRRVDGINMTIANIHSILQSLAKLDRATLSRFKDILMSRLTYTTTQTFDKGHQRSIQQLCTTLTCLVEPIHAEPGGGRGVDAAEMLIFLQKLLFASSQRFHSQVLQEDGAEVGRTIRGILLATELVKSSALSHGDKDCIQKWVLRILLPSTRRMVDPEIGWPGLCFFEALSMTGDQMSSSASAGVLHHKTELFSNLKMILANTGLIQMLAHYQQRRKPNSGTTLGYGTIPPHFHVQADTKNQRKKREMVFCLSIFMRHIETNTPHRWDCAVRWVFDLVNKYLRLGRELSGQGSSNTCSQSNGRSKWMPHSWLQAAVELPVLDIINTKGPLRPKLEETMNWIRSKLCSHELSRSDHLCESIDGDVGDLLVEGKTSSQLRALCGALSRMALALLLSLGVAAAVLANTFEHYKVETDPGLVEKGKDVSCNHGAFENQGLLRLLQYQLYKIYDLKGKCQIVQKLLRVCSASMRRYRSSTKVIAKRGNRRVMAGPHGSVGEANADKGPLLTVAESASAIDNATSVAMDCENVANETLAIVTSLFASKEFIDPTILWECLADKEYDAVFYKVLPSHDDDPLASAKDEDFGHTIWIMGCIMEHICSNKSAAAEAKDGSSLDQQLASSSMNHGVTSATTANFSHCFQQASKLLTIMPHLRKSKSDEDVDVTKVTTGYFRLILRVLESARTCRAESEPQESRRPMAATYSECLQVCGTGLVDSSVQEERNVEGRAPSADIVAFKNILSYLRMCEESAVSFTLMEILSLFAHKRKPKLIDSAVDASWRDLHTVYAETAIAGNVTPIPMALIDALRRYHQVSPQRNKTSERVLLATVVKAALNETREFTRNSLLRHSILRHWGLIALSLETSGFRHSSHVSKMIAELRSYLNSINDVQGDDFADVLYDSNTAASHDATVSAIPLLTGASFAIFYELLLYFVVAMFAVCPPSMANAAESALKHISPYQHLQQLMLHFAQLVSLFRENLKLFPRRLFPVFLGCCNHMLKLIVRQIRCCADWRNSQPLLSPKERAANVDDKGSIQYFQDLLETCVVHISDFILSFCRFMSAQPRTAKRHDSDDSAFGVGNEASWAFTSYQSKIKTLSSSAENVLILLKETAASHNLVLPPQLPVKKSSLLARDFRNDKHDQSDKGFHQMGIENGRSRKRVCRLMGENFEQSEWDEGSSDESSLWSDDGKSVKGSSASFGVAGDWGDDSDSAASKASLNLEAMDRVSAAI